MHRSLGDHYSACGAGGRGGRRNMSGPLELEPANGSLLIAAGAGYEAVDRMGRRRRGVPHGNTDAADGGGRLSGPGGVLPRPGAFRRSAGGVRDGDETSCRRKAAYAPRRPTSGLTKAMIDLALSYLDEAGVRSPSTADAGRTERKCTRRCAGPTRRRRTWSWLWRRSRRLLSAMLALGDLHREAGDSRSAQRAFVNASQLRPAYRPVVCE